MNRASGAGLIAGMLTYSPVRYHCATDAPSLLVEQWFDIRAHNMIPHLQKVFITFDSQGIKIFSS